jgi:hypothetical protein
LRTKPWSGLFLCRAKAINLSPSHPPGSYPAIKKGGFQELGGRMCGLAENASAFWSQKGLKIWKSAARTKVGTPLSARELFRFPSQAAQNGFCRLGKAFITQADLNDDLALRESGQVHSFPVTSPDEARERLSAMEKLPVNSCVFHGIVSLAGSIRHVEVVQ